MSEPEHTAEQVARRLVDTGWYQISRGHRMVARLPLGKTGKQALLEATLAAGNPKEWTETWVGCMDEYHAGDFYLRVHSKPQDQLELDRETFDLFRQFGGNTYSSKDLDRRVHEMKRAQAGQKCVDFVISLASLGCAKVLPGFPDCSIDNSGSCVFCRAGALLRDAGLLEK